MHIKMKSMVFNATFNNISVILCRSILLVEENKVPGENHRSTLCHRKTLSHIVSSKPKRNISPLIIPLKYMYKYLNFYNRPFAHSQFDSKIIHFYTFFSQVISLTTCKVVSSLARAMEKTTNLRIIFFNNCIII